MERKETGEEKRTGTLMSVHNRHQHGGEPGKLFRHFGIPARPVTDFSVNLNWMGPPEVISDQWPQMLEEAAKYPSVDGICTRDYYSKKYDIPKDCVLPGNGSAELMYRVAGSLQLPEIMILCPAFFHYQNAFIVNNTRIKFLPLDRVRKEGGLSPELLSRHITGADALFIGNPNNPTGDLFPGETLLQFARSDRNRLLLVDEAFMQFAEEPGSSSLLKDSIHEPNIIIFHSLTKFYSLPGIRLGAVISNPELINKLSLKSPPWMVNSIAERIAALLLQCDQYETDTRRLLHREKHRLKEEYSDLSGMEIYFGAGNFVYGEWRKTAELDDLLRFLLRHDLFIRDCRNFTGIRSEAFRFAILHPEKNDLLLRAFRSVTVL